MPTWVPGWEPTIGITLNWEGRMKKRYMTAIIAILSVLLAVTKQLVRQEDSEKQLIPKNSSQMIDSVMGLNHDDMLEFYLTSSEEGLSYYYGSWMDDVMGDLSASYRAAVMKDLSS